MSVDLFVKFTSLPSDVKSKWESALSTLGFEVEFHPDFDSVTWLGGLLPARMLAVDPALQTNYGKLPIIAGFELYLSKDSAHLTTSMGRTMADLRLQCLAAATLASITDGKYEDPQEGKSYSGDKALKIALKHIRNYESGANQTGARWYELFESWNPTDEP